MMYTNLNMQSDYFVKVILLWSGFWKITEHFKLSLRNCFSVLFTLCLSRFVFKTGYKPLMVFEFYRLHTPGSPYCTQRYPSSGHAVICQPWSLWRCGSDQVWFVSRRSHQVQTIYTISSHSASLCQDDGGEHGRMGVEAGQLDTEAETHLKQRGFSLQAQRKCVCVLFSLRQDNRPQLPSFVFWWFRLVLCFRKYRETTGILDLYCHNGSSWLGLTCRQPELNFFMCLAWGCVTVSFQI